MATLTTAFGAWRDQNPNAIEELREVTPDEIRDALRLGTIVNHRDEMGALVEIPWDTHYTSELPETPLPTARIDADTLAHVLRSYSGLNRGDTLDHHDLHFDPRGLRMRQVVITYDAEGAVGLGDLNLAFPLAFEGCVLRGFVALNHCTLPRLAFDTCLFDGARSSLLLDSATIQGELKLFECEGLMQFFAPDARIGSLSVGDNTLVLTPTQVASFTTNLDGARIGTLNLDGTAHPHTLMPAGACAGVSVERVRIALPRPAKPTLWAWLKTFWRQLVRKERQPIFPRTEAEWVAMWLSASTPPKWWRRLGTWKPMDTSKPAGERKTRDHQRTAWLTLSGALTRSGNLFRSRFGLTFNDQGTRLLVLAERHRDSQLSWFPRFLRWLSLDLTVRYFTANVRALAGLAVVWAAVSALAWCNIDELLREAETRGVATGTLESTWADIVWAMTYGLNFVVAPLDLGFSAVWPTSVEVLVLFAMLKLAAIVLFGLFIVGVSGVVSRARTSS